MKRFTLGALALIAMAVPASAQSWTGCYIGGEAGYSSTKTDVDVPISNGNQSVNLLSIDGIGTAGATGGGAVGCDYQIQRFVIGAFGDYLFHDQDFSASLLGGIAGVSYDVKNQWSVGGRAGVLLTDNVLAYGLVAYTQADTSDLKWNLGNQTGVISLDQLEGWTVGGGLETQIRGNWFVGAEYRYTKFDDISTNLATFGNAKIDLDTETEAHTGLLTVKYKWGGSMLPSVAPLK